MAAREILSSLQEIGAFGGYPAAFGYNSFDNKKSVVKLMARTLFFLLTVHVGTEFGQYVEEQNFVVIAEDIHSGHKRALALLQKQGMFVLFDDIAAISFDELQKIKEVKKLNVYEHTGSIFARY